MRKRARRSELTWGYSLPPWLEDAGLKSSTAGAVWAGAVSGCVACANATWPASRGINTKPIDAALMTVLLGPETVVGPTDTMMMGLLTRDAGCRPVARRGWRRATGQLCYTGSCHGSRRGRD